MIYNFYIEDLYTRTQIVEPRNWKDLQSLFERDFNTHGVFFDYTDGTLKLGFSCDARDLLEAAYQNDGIDTYYRFIATEQENQYASEVEIFNGQIDFSTRQLDLEYFSAEVNNSNSQLKFKNRSKNEINLNANKDLDGNDLNNVNYDDSIRLLGAKPRAQLNCVRQVDQADTTQSTNGYTYYTVGLQNSSGTEVEKFKPKRNYGYSSDNIVTEYYDLSGKEFLELQRDAELQITLEYDITSQVTNISGTPGTYSMELEWWTNPEHIDEAGLKHVNIIIDSAIAPTTLSDTVTYYMSLKAGGKIGLFLTIRSSNQSEVIDTTMIVNTLNLTITDVRVEKGEKTQWYQLHDALNKNLSFITGYKDYLYSDLLGGQINGYASDGCYAKTYLTNGFRIRGLNTDKKAPSFSFEKFFNSINGLESVGYGFEYIESPIELGYKQVQWIDLASGVATIRISENLTSDITVNSNLGFYDSETLYGVYNVDAISWNGSYTEIDIDVSTNTNYYDTVYGIFPEANTYTCFLTCDSSTLSRERLRLEQWEYFYQNIELLDLGIVEEYSEEPFSDIYNEIKFEFSKYANDEKRPLTLEDFHTRSAWAIPVEKSDKTKNLMIDFIASTGLINESQFNRSIEKPTTSNKLDEDIFFCDKITKQVTAVVDFNASGYIIVPDYVYDNYIYGSDKFTVSGSTSNDGTYHIDLGTPVFFKLDTEEYQIYVVESLTTDSDDSATFTPIFDGQTEYKPETQENISYSLNLTEPEFTYNQRRTFKRMLLRWGAFIRSLVSYNPGIGLLKNLFYVNNGELETQLDTTNLTGCYIDAGVVTEQDSVDISTLSAPIFKPNIINFTVKVCDSDYDLIKDAHRNADIYGRNYGYLTVTNRKGETKTGWLLRATRSPIDRILKGQLIERYV